jgi:predicted phosphodiesterase
MRLILVSDTHVARRAARFCDNWSIVAEAIRRERPACVIHLGDICADAPGHAGDLEEAAALFKDLGSEIRFLPGNHDVGDNPLERAPSSEHPLDAGEHHLDAARLAAYRQSFGPDRWSFEAEGWKVIGLNAQLLNTGSARIAGRSA